MVYGLIPSHLDILFLVTQYIEMDIYTELSAVELGKAVDSQESFKAWPPNSSAVEMTFVSRSRSLLFAILSRAEHNV